MISANGPDGVLVYDASGQRERHIEEFSTCIKIGLC